MADAPKVRLMNVVKKTGLAMLRGVLIALLSVPLSAAPPLSSSMQAYHVDQGYGSPLILSLINQLEANYDDAFEILSSAVARSPGSIRQIILVAIQEGVLPNDIAAQCETSLTGEELRTLIATALNERIDGIPIIKRCLPLVEEHEVAGLLALAINNSVPGQNELLLQVAYNTLSSSYADPFQLVKAGVLQSNAFTVQGLAFTQGMDTLLDEIRLQDTLENMSLGDAAGQDEVDQDFYDPGESDPGGIDVIIDPEPPNSSS